MILNLLISDQPFVRDFWCKYNQKEGHFYLFTEVISYKEGNNDLAEYLQVFMFVCVSL